MHLFSIWRNHITKRYQVNDRIRAKELRVVDEGGNNVGIISTQDALARARAAGLDLVVISGNSDPQVAKVLDFKKFLYEENKKRSSIKAKSKRSELKELQLRPTTGQGDVDQRIVRAREFIEEGNRVKFAVSMRGRQNLFPDIALQKLEAVTKELRDVAKQESEPKLNGNTYWVVLVRK